MNAKEPKRIMQNYIHELHFTTFDRHPYPGQLTFYSIKCLYIKYLAVES